MPGRLPRAFPVLPTYAALWYDRTRLSDLPRVLLVDDLETNRFLLEEALGEIAAEILTAGGGAEALAIVARARPAVVVVDFQMPSMSGAETSRRIKQEPVPFTYVILTSGYREAEESVSFRASLADRFLPKPYRLDELRAAVEEGLQITLAKRGQSTFPGG